MQLGSAHCASQAGLARGSRPTWPFSPRPRSRGALAIGTLWDFVKSSALYLSIHMEFNLRLSFYLRRSIGGTWWAPPQDSQLRS
jgi:hypothetical protein